MIFPIVIVGFALIGPSLQRTEDEIKQWFIAKVLECNKLYPITDNELRMLKEHQIPDSDTSKCLNACVFKKVEWIDTAGNYDSDRALMWVSKELSENQKGKFTADSRKMEKAQNVFKTCQTVNENSVSDGSKGCDRSYYLSKCLIENAKKMGFLS